MQRLTQSPPRSDDGVWLWSQLKMWKRFNTPPAAALITAAAIGLFLLGRLSHFGFDWSTFVVAGEVFVDGTKAPASLKVMSPGDGYDGQFYYRLALDPFTSETTKFGVRLDLPAYRQQRILYPALTSILSLGRADLIPLMMVVLNWSGLCVLAWIGAVYAQSFDRAALWGVALALQPAFLFTLTRDLTEILEVTLVLGSLLLLQRRRPLAASCFLTLAVLARETALLVAVAALLLFAFQSWNRRQKQTLRWHYFVIPIVVFSCWQGWLYRHWGGLPLATGATHLCAPFAGPIALLRDVMALRTSMERRELLELLFLIVFGWGVLLQLRRTPLALEAVSFLLYAALAVSVSGLVWREDWGFFRVVSQSCALGAVITIVGHSRMRTLMLCGSVVFWVYLAEKLTRHYA